MRRISLRSLVRVWQLRCIWGWGIFWRAQQSRTSFTITMNFLATSFLRSKTRIFLGSQSSVPTKSRPANLLSLWVTRRGGQRVLISVITTFLCFDIKSEAIPLNSSTIALLDSFKTISRQSWAKVEMNSSTCSTLILLITSRSSEAAFALVTSAFFRSRAKRRLTSGSWYSTKGVFWTKRCSSSVVVSLPWRREADSWLKTLVFWPISSPVSTFFFRAFPFTFSIVKELLQVLQGPNYSLKKELISNQHQAEANQRTGRKNRSVQRTQQNQSISLLLEFIILKSYSMEAQFPTLTYPSAKSFVAGTRDLLAKQKQSEIELFQDLTNNKTIAEIEASGYGLSNMVITSSKRGYYGKTVLSLTKAYHSEKNPCLLPEDCRIQVGDDVSIKHNNTIVAEGIVSKRIGPKLQISTRNELDDEQDLEGTPCCVVLRWNEVTYTRYFRALEDLEHSQNPLIPLFFTPARGPPSSSVLKEQTRVDPKLNKEQSEAVELAMNEQVFLLHGPPGTGKTTTICVAILEAVKKGWKVLACGPSNISVDNMVEGLAGKTECLRIGNPARIIPSVLQNCLDFQIAVHSSNWKGELKKLQAVKKRLSRGGTKEERRTLRAEAKQIKEEVSRLQEQVIQEVLQDAKVLCCTNVGAADRVFKKYLSKRIFDLVVIDECAQALEIGCWIPLLKGRRALLAGDHKQLPPTIQNHSNSLLSYTLFSRAMEELSHIPSTMLKVQYRMNKSIMGWSNQQFYQGQLSAHSSVEAHTLQQLCGQLSGEEQLLLVDTGGCWMGEEGSQNESKFNVGEADLTVAIYRKLLKFGVEPNLVAILTPYSKQVALIKATLTEQDLSPPDVSTVDGIQGREKECIIISMVRSNPDRQIGFLSDWRRMNVAVTRARRMLILIGNAECVSKDPHIHALIEWVESHGHVSSAEEFREDPTIRFGLGAGERSEDKDKNGQRGEKKCGTEKDKTGGEGGKGKNRKREGGKQKERKEEHGQEEQEGVKNHFRAVLSQMSKELTINNASAFERKMIHEVAEELGMAHETAPNKQYIKVWKKMTNDEVAQLYAELQEAKMEEDRKELKKLEKKKQKMRKRAENKKQAKGTHSSQLGAFSQLEVEEGEDEEEQKLEQGAGETEEEGKERPKVEEENPQPARGGKNRNKKKNHKNKEPSKQEEEDDIEQLMKEFNADRPKEDQCFKCNRKLTSVTSTTCKFCSINFCRAHVLAEEHGCDEVAKQAARRPNLTEKQLQQATCKMQAKIKEQEESRKKKNKNSNAKK